MSSKSIKSSTKNKTAYSRSSKITAGKKPAEEANPQLTVEQIQEKIENLKKLQKQIDPTFEAEKKSRLPSFQTIYIIFEIFMCLAVIALGLYVYQVSQQRQEMMKNAVKLAEASKKAQSEEILPQTAANLYDEEEYCSSNDQCDDITIVAKQQVEEEELETFLNN